MDAELVEPRLSIGHLMVWAACVALYCSAYQTLLHELVSTATGLNAVRWSLHCLFSGTAVAALPLLVARRIRAHPFPQYGGEFLWLFSGIQVTLFLICIAVDRLDSPSFLFPPLATILRFVFLPIWGALYLYAVLRVREYRWKVVFVLIVGIAIVSRIADIFFARYAYSSISSPFSYLAGVHLTRELLIAWIVAMAALTDLRQPRRLPWTHWSGVILQFLQFVLTLFWLFVSLVARGQLVH